MRDLVEYPKHTQVSRSLPPDVVIINPANKPFLEGRAPYPQLPRIGLFITALLAIIFAVLVVLTLLHADSERRFRSDNQTTQGEVLDRRSSTYRCGKNNSSTCTNYYITLRFSPDGERTLRHEIMVNSGTYESSPRGAPITVYYDAATPTDFRIDGQVDETGNMFLGLLIFAGIFLAILIMTAGFETYQSIRLSRSGTLLYATQPSVESGVNPLHVLRTRGKRTKAYTLPIPTASGTEIKEFKQTVTRSQLNALYKQPDLKDKKLAVLYIGPRMYRAL